MSPAAAAFLCAIAGARVFLLFTFLLQYFSRTYTTYKSEERERERERERETKRERDLDRFFLGPRPNLPSTPPCSLVAAQIFRRLRSFYDLSSRNHRPRPLTPLIVLEPSLTFLRRLIDACLLNTVARFERALVSFRPRFLNAAKR